MEQQTNKITWERIKSLFKRKQQEEAFQTDIKPDQTTETKEIPSEWYSIYGHGFQNGVYRINKLDDAFPEFLEKSSELERIETHKAFVAAEIKKLSIQLEEDEKKLFNWNNDKIAAEVSAATTKDELNFIKEKRGHFENRNKALQAIRENIKPEYGWIPALMFLAAGVLFILGDISITKDITTNGFQMSQGEGIWFAIGLAMVSFIIKPLFDRIFEKPFQRANVDPNKAYKIVLYTITGLGLVMLILLGKFRAEAFSILAEITEINTKMGQDESDPVKLGNQLATLSKQLGNNQWGQWGLILSTIVFAIGGAMCLSVAFPSLTQLMNRYWFIPIRTSFNNKLVKGKIRYQDKLQQRLDQSETIKLQAVKNLEHLKILELKQQLSDAQSKFSHWLDEYYSTKTGKEKSLYTDGYLRGEKYSMEGDLKFKIVDPLAKTGTNKSSNEETVTGEARKYTRRPFVKIRKMIADNYNQKQNTAAKDETEFEILS